MQGHIAQQPGTLESPAARNPSTVLVAPSIGREEAAELVEMAAQLFDEDDDVRVVVKCHPMMPPEKIGDLNSERLPDHVQFSDKPINELMASSSVMVYSGSSVGTEALGIGLPVVHLRTSFDFDLDPLEEAPGARLEATGLEELREKVRWVLAHREEYIAQHREEWGCLVDDIYGPVTDDTIQAFLQ